MNYFNIYNKIITKYDVTKKDTWNFNEIKYRMSITRSD